MHASSSPHLEHACDEVEARKQADDHHRVIEAVEHERDRLNQVQQHLMARVQGDGAFSIQQRADLEEEFPLERRQHERLKAR